MLIPPTYNTSCCAAQLLADVDACLTKQLRLCLPLPNCVQQPPVLPLTACSYLDWADDDALVVGRQAAPLHSTPPRTRGCCHPPTAFHCRRRTSPAFTYPPPPLCSDVFHWSTYGQDSGANLNGSFAKPRCNYCAVLLRPA